MGWLRVDSRRRRILLALGVYVVATGVYFAFASRNRLVGHTPWNHFALLAEAWLDGRLDLGGQPPGYAGNNDFAKFGEKWFVVFPPFPAVLLVPVVAFGGSATNVQDGQFFLWLAGIGPAVLFLVLEKLRRTGRSERSVRTNLGLSVLFAFGTVYFFTAEQGTVWYAAHVVAVALTGLYVLFALDAERPFWAGLMLGLAFMTRSPVLFAAPLFALEALRVSLVDSDGAPPKSILARLADGWRRLDGKKLFRLMLEFSGPVALVVGVAFWHNRARFGSALDFGYSHLQIGWRPRLEKWGLFHYHYLGKNLGVVFTNLPWWVKGGSAPFQINVHGLALWFTSPFLLWLMWPKRTGWLHASLWVTAFAVAIPTLFYQNTGWVQFGYRFSNDYAVFLFALLAIGGRPLGTLFQTAALWAIVVNGFGALTFDRSDHKKFYYQDNSQRTLFQPD